MIFLGLYDYGVYQFSWFFFREDLIFGGYLEFMSLLFVKADKSQKAVLKSNSFKILDDKHIIQFSWIFCYFIVASLLSFSTKYSCQQS
jgi:hypothetical protein